MTQRRVYNSENRNSQAIETKSRILNSAKKLFSKEGFDRVTISALADHASVSAPTIYALFKSKRGVLQALIDSALPSTDFESLVSESMSEPSPEKRLALTAKLARQIYDAESDFLNIFRGASVLSPELKKLEMEREKRRYERQGDYVKKMIKEKVLKNELNEKKARDILWSLTGRDLYRLFVLERKWSPAEYETYLGKLLKDALLNEL